MEIDMQNNSNRPIGMFDSGVGGLTVYKEIKNMFPNEKIIYVGDTARFPYGSKNQDTIIKSSEKIVEFLLTQNVKMIIIACGTATSFALKTLKQEYDIPIIGIIEETVKFIKEKNFKNVGVIATRGTIKSNSWEKNLKEQIPDVKVYNKSCPLLAPMAEEGWTDNNIAKETVKEYLKDFKNIDLDCLILGCTHYPLFENIIKDNIPKKTYIINTGKILASSLKRDIPKLNNDGIIKLDNFYLTDTEENFINIADKLLGKKVNINYINI